MFLQLRYGKDLGVRPNGGDNVHDLEDFSTCQDQTSTKRATNGTVTDTTSNTLLPRHPPRITLSAENLTSGRRLGIIPATRVRQNKSKSKCEWLMQHALFHGIFCTDAGECSFLSRATCLPCLSEPDCAVSGPSTALCFFYALRKQRLFRTPDFT